MIKTENITKIYRTGSIEVSALKDVSIFIDKGEFVAIMGASGSGKSTMMNILGCLDSPTDGKYYLDDADISSLDDTALAKVRNKKIGFVFQSFNLLPKLTALNNVELPMLYADIQQKKRRRKAIEALERVGLSDRARHKPNELSGGQRQRVAIARALVNDPSILLADEPTGNLDSASSMEIMEVFSSINSDGATIVLVTHEQDIASITKRKIVFKDGVVISDKMTAEEDEL